MKDASRLLTIVCLTACATPAPPAPADTAPSTRTVAEEIGSLRNARVAIAMPAKRIELTYFAQTISPSELAELGKLAPNVRIVTGLTGEAALPRAGEADGIDARYATPEFLARAKKLVWVQVRRAGLEHVPVDAIAKNEAIVLTNFRAADGPSIADHAMAMLLSLTRNLRDYAAAQAGRRWRGGENPIHPPIALAGRTMLVVGIGGIGTEVGRRAHGFGMHVIGTRRTTAPSPKFFERVGLSKDLLAMLPQADVVAICVPLTRETEGMFNRAAFAAMRRDSYFINVSRGKVVDTAALVAALTDGTLAGAGLDVVDPEPLPAEHPLWGLPNVILTPHIAGASEMTARLRSALLVENIRRFGAGEPLLNVVDKQAGY